MFAAQQVQDLEEKAFRGGISADELMEKVGRQMARVILQEYAVPGKAIAFLGKGHNAGDALVVLRYLQEFGWNVAIRKSSGEEELALLTRTKLKKVRLDEPEDLVRGRLLLLDGLLGIGARGEVRGTVRELADEMNELRLTSGAKTIAMDIPSGLDPDTGAHGCVVADHTLTVGVPKCGLVADEAIDFVGRLSLIELVEFPLPCGGDQLITANSLRSLFPPRPYSFHKGNAGRLAIIAGSPGLQGAASLCSEGALRGGTGLITLWADGCPQTSPEIMVRQRSANWSEVYSLKPDALVIGPGLGMECADELFAFLEELTIPVVIDADALNLIAKFDRRDLLTDNVVVTPHPGEMSRLFSYEGTRVEKARAFSENYPSILLLKGARTIVTRREEGCYYNTTGSPGMATGGQGDLLSGVIGALLAQGMTPLHAARAGAWLTGRAAELAQVSEQSLTPSDVGDALGRAFLSVFSLLASEQ